MTTMKNIILLITLIQITFANHALQKSTEKRVIAVFEKCAEKHPAMVDVRYIMPVDEPDITEFWDSQ